MTLLSPENWSLAFSVIVFLLCATSIGVVGTWITRVVDQLADVTGVGEAVAGALLLGAATSLSGAVLSVTAAWNGSADLAVGNALGGIAVQTLFLAVADFFHRRANLEHAAASAANMLQNALLISLLALILLAPNLPDATIWGIHPVTPVLLCFYAFGIRMVRTARREPMWQPSSTHNTEPDTPDDTSRMPSQGRLLTTFAVLAAVLGVSGWLLEPAASNIAADLGVSLSVVGVLMTAVVTSLPELVTSVAAVRRGALTLAIGGIIGGNAFDTLFTAASDVAYREGSIYHAIPDALIEWLALTLLMCGVLMMGLVRRQERGLAGIGFESVAIIGLYVLGVVLMLVDGG